MSPLNESLVAPEGEGAMRQAEPETPQRSFTERCRERRADPVLGALVDVAIAYRDNVGRKVAEAFLRETGVPETVALRVLNRSAQQRAMTPRRWTAQVFPGPMRGARAPEPGGTPGALQRGQNKANSRIAQVVDRPVAESWRQQVVDEPGST